MPATWRRPRFGLRPFLCPWGRHKRPAFGSSSSSRPFRGGNESHLFLSVDDPTKPCWFRVLPEQPRKMATAEALYPRDSKQAQRLGTRRCIPIIAPADISIKDPSLGGRTNSCVKWGASESPANGRTWPRRSISSMPRFISRIFRTKTPCSSIIQANWSLDFHLRVMTKNGAIYMWTAW